MTKLHKPVLSKTKTKTLPKAFEITEALKKDLQASIRKTLLKKGPAHPKALAEELTQTVLDILADYEPTTQLHGKPPLVAS